MVANLGATNRAANCSATVEVGGRAPATQSTPPTPPPHKAIKWHIQRNLRPIIFQFAIHI